MKTLTTAIILSLALSACTAQVYTNKGNATVLTSKDISKDVSELTVRRDNGEVLTIQREYDAHATAGARIYLADPYENRSSDLTTIRRWEFK